MRTKSEISLCFLAFSILCSGGAGAIAHAQDNFDPKPPVPEGCRLVEGDVLVPISRAKSTYTGWKSGLQWPDGVVPYEFDDNVTEANQQAMRAAMDVWEAVANVRFKPKDWWEPFWIHIQNSTGNSSPVGMWGVANNTVSIASWNSRYTIVHELGHTLGFWHEQSRSDRDAYIQIITANIQSGKEDQFEKHDEANHYGPYDFESVMHYPQCAFSIDCPPGSTCGCTRVTIQTLSPYNQWQNVMGQRNRLSRFDAMTMSFLYPEPNWRFVDGAYTEFTEDGTFQSPFKSFGAGFQNVPIGGTLWFQPGSYQAAGTYNKAGTWQAPLGGVTIY